MTGAAIALAFFTAAGGLWRAACPAGPARIEKAVPVPGTGRTAVFVDCGPITARGPEAGFSKGVAILAGGRLVARWHSPTASRMRQIYPLALDGAWNASSSPLVSVALQLGGRTLTLWVLKFRRGSLVEAGRWQGVAGAELRRTAGHMIAVIEPYDRLKFPHVWICGGAKFEPVLRDQQQIFAALGAGYVRELTNRRPARASSLTFFCRRALQAYKLAGQRAPALRACRVALARLVAGAAIAPGFPGEGRVHRQQAIVSAEESIRRLLARFASARNAR